MFAFAYKTDYKVESQQAAVEVGKQAGDEEVNMPDGRQNISSFHSLFPFCRHL